MKTIKLIVFITGLLCCAMTSAQNSKTVQTMIVQTNIECDHCKHCETCGGLLERTLIKDKGIQMIALDEKAMTIKIIYNSKKTNPATIRRAISRLGYDADDIKAEPSAVALLDSCCKP